MRKKLNLKSFLVLFLLSTIGLSFLQAGTVFADPGSGMSGNYATPTLNKVSNNNIVWPSSGLTLTYVDRATIAVALPQGSGTNVNTANASSKTLGQLFAGTYKLTFMSVTNKNDASAGGDSVKTVPLYCQNGGKNSFPEYQFSPNSRSLSDYTNYEPSVPCIAFKSDSDIANILKNSYPLGSVNASGLPGQFGTSSNDGNRAYFIPVGAIGSWFGGDDPCSTTNWFKNVGLVNDGSIKWRCGNRQKGPCNGFSDNRTDCNDWRFDSVVLGLGNNLDKNSVNNVNITLASNADGTVLTSLTPNQDDPTKYKTFTWCPTLSEYVYDKDCGTNQISSTAIITGRKTTDFVGASTQTIPVQVTLPGNKTVTAVVRKGTTGDSNTPVTSGTGTGTATCIGGSLGWVLCPAIQAIRGTSDKVAAYIDSLLQTNPLDSSSPVYDGWNNIRNIANVLFVIGFIIIIFSQATSIGLTSYGVKKMLPKIIAAAIAVNISFFVCQVAVDISNITGSSITGLLANISNVKCAGDATAPTPGGSAPVNIGSCAAAQIDQVGQDNSNNGTGKFLTDVGLIVLAILLIMPILLMIIATFAALAFRSAIIVLLVMISPLAFAAWLLPNTEKWFNKWLDMFLRMLALYPLIMFVFASATVASSIIAKTAGTGNIQLVIALIIQALPLFSIPILFKASGGLMGKIHSAAHSASRKASDSKIGQGVRTRGKRYAKFGALGAAGGVGAGIKATGVGKTRFGQGAVRAGQGARKGWQNVVAADRSLELIEEARKTSKNKERDTRAYGMVGAENPISQAMAGYAGSSMANLSAKLESQGLEEAVSKLERTIKDKNLQTSDLQAAIAEHAQTGVDRHGLGLGTLQGNAALSQRLMSQDMLTPSHAEALVNGLEGQEKVAMAERISKDAVAKGQKHLTYGGVDATTGKYDQYLNKSAALIVDSGLSGTTKETLQDTQILDAIGAKAAASTADRDELVRQTMHIDHAATKQQLADKLTGGSVAALDTIRDTYRSDKR